MNVFGEIGELIFTRDSNGLVAPLEEGADALVASIKITNVFGDYGAHKMANAVIRILFEHEMKMVGHEAVGEELDFSGIVFESLRGRYLRGLSSKVGDSEIELKIGEESGVVFGVFENEALVDATVVEVVVATWLVLFERIFAGHYFEYTP